MNKTLAVRRSHVDRRIQATRAGYEFDPASHLWALDKDKTLNLRLAFCYLAVSLRDPYRAVMSRLVQNYAGGYCVSLQEQLVEFLKRTGADHFTTTALLNYRAQLDRNTEYKIARLRCLLRHWFELGYPGVSPEVADLLDLWTLKGNSKGGPVKSRHPLEGPLDDVELQTFNEVAAQMYEKKEITTANLAFALLLSHTGRRPVQISMIRIGHIYSGKKRNGDPEYVVTIPRAKQPGQAPGSEVKGFEIEGRLYRLLKAQADEVVKEVSSLLNFFPQSLIGLLPLFPKWSQFQDISDADMLRHRLRNHSLFETVQAMSSKLRKFKLFSQRAGRLHSVPPRRFRYTIGTRASRLGFGEYVIAELLDHSDTQSAKIYIRNHPNFYSGVGEIMNPPLTSLAQRYFGTPIDREGESTDCADLSTHVRSPDGKLGVCGSKGICGAIPYACYTCHNYRPFVHARHQQVLERLVADRQRVLKLGGDEAIAVATDRSIQGVLQVISRCESRKLELEEERNE